MTQNVMVELIRNASTLLVLSVVYVIFYLFPSKNVYAQKIFSGIAISLICVAVMAIPLTLQPGIVFDTRSILISVTALIFGLIPTAITAFTAILFRLSMGGAGAIPGVAVILTSALIGLAWRRWVYPKMQKWRGLSVLLMSILVHIVMITCMLLIPYPVNITVIQAIAVPVMIIYPIAAVLLSLLLIRQQVYKHVQDQLKQSEERFRTLFDKAPLGYQSLDADGHFIDVNQQWLDTLGYTRDDVIGHWFGDFLLPEYRDAFRQRFEIFKKQGYIHSEFEMLSKVGKPMFIAFEGKIASDMNGKFTQTHCILQDITSQRLSNEALQASEEKYRLLYSAMTQGLALHEIITDDNGKPVDYRFLDINDSYTRLLGVTREMCIGKTITEVMPRVESYWIDVFGKVALTGEPMYYENYLATTGRYYATYSYSYQKRRFAVLVTDITEQRDYQENLKFMSFHDYMTGLYNRRFFEDELQRNDQESQLPLSVIMGDINGVKLVNDAFGHAEGDKLILDTANIISGCCRKEDIVARVGGDEFGILMPGTDSATAMTVVQKIRNALNAFDADNPHDKFRHSISLGYSTKNTPADDLMNVLKMADENMYQRKLLEHNSSHSAIITAIKATMIAKSQETEEHAERLVALTNMIATKLHLSANQHDQLELLSTLHDIGKVGIRDEILRKPAKLNEEEWVEMRRHPEIGYRIALSSPDLSLIAESILSHHERWDGGGYPQGLSGEHIPLLARILAVADTYDAMTQDRPYRKATSHQEAIDEIVRCSGKQFDPQIVTIFIANIGELNV